MMIFVGSLAISLMKHALSCAFLCFLVTCIYSKFPEEKTVLKLMASEPGCQSLNSEFWAKVGTKLW